MELREQHGPERTVDNALASDSAMACTDTTQFAAPQSR